MIVHIGSVAGKMKVVGRWVRLASVLTGEMQVRVYVNSELLCYKSDK